MIKYERMIEILKKSVEKRCEENRNEFSCGDSEKQCKRCVKYALNLTDEEYDELFDE